jgi:hypothetical protein
LNTVRLFCYVIDHDTGLAPNPSNRVCTLVYCKYKKPKSRRRNVVELAKKGDWVIGVGGKSKKSCGHGKIVYIMQVDKPLSFSEYRRRFPNRRSPNRRRWPWHGEWALISRQFLYYGREGIPVDRIPGAEKFHLEDTGRGFRNTFPDTFVLQVADWFRKQHPSGKIGEPWVFGLDASARRTCHCREQP